LGYFENGQLWYAGKVGTGFDDRTLADLRKRLDRLETGADPFGQEGIAGPGIHWVEPRLVAQVRFTEWTGDGKLRHPRFLGLRRDKSPRKVVREES
jgi:bifunctional non-homologous end joining protein LigD